MKHIDVKDTFVMITVVLMALHKRKTNLYDLRLNFFVRGYLNTCVLFIKTLRGRHSFIFSKNNLNNKEIKEKAEQSIQIFINPLAQDKKENDNIHFFLTANSDSFKILPLLDVIIIGLVSRDRRVGSGSKKVQSTGSGSEKV
jgi:hypothetical protein